jgi:prolyl 4-hydroxylase
MKSSGVVEAEGGAQRGGGEESKAVRDSRTHFLKAVTAPLEELDLKIANLMKITLDTLDITQVLKYGKRQFYSAHHDYFKVDDYPGNERMSSMLDGGLKNRLATVFWYLSDVSEGGETIFLKAGGKDEPSDLWSCSGQDGFKVKAEKGKVIVWYNLDFAGQFNLDSLHAGCPVGKGQIKWAANKWVWNAPGVFSQYYEKSTQE